MFKKASYTNNPIEFKPGDKVFQIFPVARPLIGVVTGSNKVEGKVYVNWNGRTMQVDPEEIQLAAGMPFFPVSRKASKTESKQLHKIATALSKSKSPATNPKFHSDFETQLTKQGINQEEADDIAHAYEDAFQKRMACDVFLDPVLPMSGEPVVILNTDGSRPGHVGILVGTENGQAIVDLAAGWSPTSNGSRLTQVPMMAVIPINSPMREITARNNPGMEPNEAKVKADPKRVACRAMDLFLNCVKTVDVFNNENFKAWVQTNSTPNGDIIVSSVVEEGGVQDPLLQRFPIFEQKLCGFNNIQNQTDYENAAQRVAALIDNCRSAILQHFRNNVVPNYVEMQCRESVQRDRKASEEKKVNEYSFEDLGVENSQYFQGAGTSYTKWEDVYVGIGSNPYDAAEDALDSAAQSGWDVENINNDLPKEDTVPEEAEDIYQYVGFYVK